MLKGEDYMGDYNVVPAPSEQLGQKIDFAVLLGGTVILDIDVEIVSPVNLMFYLKYYLVKPNYQLTIPSDLIRVLGYPFQRKGTVSATRKNKFSVLREKVECG